MSIEQHYWVLRIENQGNSMFKFLDQCEANNYQFDSSAYFVDEDNSMTFLFTMNREQAERLKTIKSSLPIFGIWNRTMLFRRRPTGELIYGARSTVTNIPDWIFNEIKTVIDKRNNYHKNYYLLNKEKIEETNRINLRKWKCECGVYTCFQRLKQHKKSSKHRHYYRG